MAATVMPFLDEPTPKSQYAESSPGPGSVRIGGQPPTKKTMSEN